MADQFGFRPTGSTTCALVNILHNVHQMFDDGNDYVRCILIDYSKAFDVINHGILLKELAGLRLHRSIYKWIASFALPITRSIVQGSGIGPMLYIINAQKLKTLSTKNSLIKYADDTTLLAPQHTNCDIEIEFEHIRQWSAAYKLTINKAKCVEIIFWRTTRIKCRYTVPNILEIQRVECVKLLGVFITSNLSWSMQVDYVLRAVSQNFYLIKQIRSMSLNMVSLNQIYYIMHCMVLSRIQYALPAYYGFLLQADKDRIDALMRKAKRWALTSLKNNRH